MKPDLKRKKIFEIYSANFSRCSELFEIRIHSHLNEKLVDNKEFYACPTCFDIHDKSSLNQDIPNPLTLEDVPPISLGGKARILTCKKCNNSFGASLDSNLNKDLNIQRLKQGDSTPIKSTLDLGFGKFKTQLNYDKAKNKWHLIYNRNPYLQSKIAEIQENWDGMKFNINVEGGIPSEIILAHVRIGYLKLFEFFGYAYILSKSGQFITEQLLSKKWVR